MSNVLSIGAVTATLERLLKGVATDDGGTVAVTTLPLDKSAAFGGAKGRERVNLFLYQVLPNPVSRNMPPPLADVPGRISRTSLLLDLSYLVTVYGKSGDESISAHGILGRAMQVLHDHSILSPEEIRAAAPDEDLPDQIENVRVTHEPLTLEELSNLWSISRTAYRLSVAYKASVVLSDTAGVRKVGLPVSHR